MSIDLNTQLATMKEFLDNEQLVNGTIMTEDGGAFKVHMEFIAAISPYFRRAVVSNEENTSFLIPGVCKEVVGNIINFMYTRQLKLSMNTMNDLIKIGKMLEVPHVMKLCRKYLISQLNDENCMKIYISPEYLQITGLKDEVRIYILQHFQQVFPISREYLNLDINDLMVILNSDDLNVTSENYVFWAIMRWVEQDPAIRMKHLPDLMRCIRFGLCDHQFYVYNIEKHPYIANNEECQIIMLQTSQLFADMTHDSGDNQFNVLLDTKHPFLRPRIPNEIIFVTGGWTAGAPTDIIETFDVKSGRWFLSVKTGIIPRAYHGMLWHKGYIYVIGGFNGKEYFNEVRRFDPVSHIWEEKGRMYFQRCYVSVASLGNYIYAMGGFDGNRRTRSCERYDPEYNQWKMIADMTEVRSDASADVLSGKIYIAGGFNGQAVLYSAERYDPETATWTQINNMTSARSGVKLIAYNGYIFAIGGFDGHERLQTVEFFDPRTEMWRHIPDMNEPRSNFATAVMYDCLYVFGGYNGVSTTSQVECFDHRKNIWTRVTELNVNRSALAACTVKDLPNAHEYTFHGNAPNGLHMA